jgi:hypothetical protein
MFSNKFNKRNHNVKKLSTIIFGILSLLLTFSCISEQEKKSTHRPVPVNPEYESQGNFKFISGQLDQLIFDIKLPEATLLKKA